MTIASDIAELRREREPLRRTLAELDQAVITAGTELDPDRQRTYDRARLELERLDDRIGALTDRDLSLAAGAGPRGGEVLGRSRIYRQGGLFNPVSDMYGSLHGNPVAIARILENNTLNRDVATVPGWVTDFDGGVTLPPEWQIRAAVARRGRPFADRIGSRPLSVYYANVAAKATLSSPAASGAPQISTWTIDQASAPDLRPIPIGATIEVDAARIELGGVDTSGLLAELTEARNLLIEHELFWGNGHSVRQVPGIFNATLTTAITATSATSGAPELWSLATSAAQSISEAAPYSDAVIVMSRARWNRLLSTVDAAARPALGLRSEPGGRTFADLEVVLSAGVLTTSGADTHVVVTTPDELRFYEPDPGRPTKLRLSPVSLARGVYELTAFGYCAFTAERNPGATVVISALPDPGA